jgi:hypothetical protein
MSSLSVENTSGNATATTTKPATVKNTPAAPLSLLQAIQNFDGFNKNKITTQSSQSSDSNTAVQSDSSILDQLKNELIKRAQFLSNY